MILVIAGLKHKNWFLGS